ncbi:tail fiber assembly protein [Proteus hauseri]|uniref:tail fiber assembly protein n=1 Tax=Proteus hauseri TaxID=183417 RepID=UPI001009646E|nr:tail fiber assembly protein [Proteus hauseri]QAV24705.1 phage tail protein [Proteus hauseri]
MYYYSAKENAFYPEALKQDYINANTFPDDAVIVDDKVWLIFEINQPPIGMVRVAGKDGLPQWNKHPLLSPIELVKQAQYERTLRLNEVSKYTQNWQTQLMLGIISENDKDKLLKWMKYAQLLQAMEITTIIDLHWPAKPE